MQESAPDIHYDLRRFVLIAGGLAFLLLLVRTAWLDDDAYITFRTVDNFLNGYGLRWNVVDRVQSYTHPLWLFLVSGAAAFTGEIYFASIVLAIILSMTALVVISAGIAKSAAGALLGFSAAALSKAFVDYSTSGLENPLTHLLLAVFFLLYFGRWEGHRRVFTLSLLASLLAVNRPDTILLVVPALAVDIHAYGFRRSVAPVLLGILPLIAWETFSIIYYGFPFPNTAYSKLKTSIPRPELLFQGMLYLLDSLSNDPLTLTVISAGLLAPVVVGSGWSIPAGIAFYMAYTVWVGGDFMSGRFLTGPFVCALASIIRQPSVEFGGKWAAGMAVVWVIGLSAPRPTILSGAKYGSDIEPARVIAPTGITDERRYYYPQTGLLTVVRGEPRPNHKWTRMGQDLRARGERFFYTDAAGFIGYAAGPGVHFVDKYGLGDPLIARLPSDTPWRIGHFLRHEPEGYRETILSGRDVIRDPGVAAYYERLKIITQGPIWSRQRWRTLLRMNLGSYEHYLDGYGVIRVSLPEIAGGDLNREITLGLRGIEVSLDRRDRVSRIDLSVSRNDDYLVILFNHGGKVAEAALKQVLTTDGRLVERSISLAQPVEADLVRVLPSGGDSRYGIGTLNVSR